MNKLIVLLFILSLACANSFSQTTNDGNDNHYTIFRSQSRKAALQYVRPNKLTDDQVNKITETYIAFFSAVSAQDAKVYTAHPDEPALLSESGQHKLVETENKIQLLLTADQWQKYQESKSSANNNK